MHDHCGVASIVDIEGTTDVVPIAVRIAEGLQHRGELGAGIAAVRDQLLRVHKNNGLVHDVLNPKSIASISGPAAIVHTRYATSDRRDPELAQPFSSQSGTPDTTFAFGFNGNIANHDSIRNQLKERNISLTSNVDTELILRLLIEHIRTNTRQNMAGALRSLESQLDGTFNIAAVSGNGETFAYRNANGIRPLAYSVIGNRFVIAASENSAITSVFPTAATKDIEPGQLLSAGNGAWHIENIAEDAQIARCFFEWIYFANFLSTLDTVSVRGARMRCGKHLAKADDDIPPDSIVVPVPDSAIVAAEGYSQTKNLQQAYAISKTREGRTFIAGKEDRVKKAMQKYAIDSSAIAGKNIVLIDDSMVRSTTMRVLIERLRKEGKVADIHLRIASPPILAPCYYGIDFATTDELIARAHHPSVLLSDTLDSSTLSNIASDIGVDSLRYLSIGAVRDILHKYQSEICMACINGCYPTPFGQELYARACEKERDRPDVAYYQL